jgi:hypothetical protein
MSGKLIAGVIGALIGVGVVVGAVLAFLNSKRMKVKRAVSKAGNAMYSIGSMLCGMSTVLCGDTCEQS